MRDISMVMVPTTFLERLNGMLEKLEWLYSEKTNDAPMWMWVKSEDARAMFGVSSKTWQTWRDRKDIPYSQFGKKIYYHLDDLNAFMKEYKIQSNDSH